MENTTANTPKIDKRIRKTKRAIRIAFMSLAADKNSNEITVTEISDAADINRKTFYVYYKDVDDIIREIENEIIEKFVNIINRQDIIKIIVNPNLMYSIFTGIINENINFYTLLINSSLIDTMFEKIKNIIRDNMLVALEGKTAVSPEMLKYIIEYVAGGLISAYKVWFKTDQKILLEDLSKQIAMVVSAGIKPIIKIDIDKSI